MLLVEAMAKAATDKNFKFTKPGEWTVDGYVWCPNGDVFLEEDGKMYTPCTDALFLTGYEEYEEPIEYFGIEKAIKYLRKGFEVCVNKKRDQVVKFENGKIYLKVIGKYNDTWGETTEMSVSFAKMCSECYSLYK